MTVLANFILNSDFTAEKQEPTPYEATLSVPARSLSGSSVSYEYTNDITIPSGKYFEVVALNTSLDGDKWYPGNNAKVAVLHKNGEYYHTIISCGKISNDTIRLASRFYSWYPDGTLNIPAYTVKAKIHLSVSPFE